MSAAATRGVAGYIAGWQPSAAVPAEAAAFARQVVAGCGPLGRDRAKSLLRGASRLAARAIPPGMEPAGEVLLHPSVIERFTAHAPGISGAARRTLRTNLRFAARRVVPHLDPADAPLPRGRAKAPYTAADIAGYLALAGAQPTTGRRMRATALVCLGAGAGAAASFAGDQFLTGGDKPERGNITNPLTRSLAGGGGLPPLDTSRLRATWLAGCAALIGLPAFMRAAGISCCQRLGDITAGLDPGSQEDAVALPGAAVP